MNSVIQPTARITGVKLSKSTNARVMPPGRYSFSLRQRQLQTGWALPGEVSQYLPFAGTGPFSAEHTKSTFLAPAVDMIATGPWNQVTVAVTGFKRTSSVSGQFLHYDAHMLSTDGGRNWVEYGTYAPSPNTEPYTVTLEVDTSKLRNTLQSASDVR